MSNRALFLDRDGVVNVDYGYVSHKDDFHFVQGIFELVKAANTNGYLVVIITNQAGIGRGYYSEKSFLGLMDWVRTEFRKHHCCIDAVYHCPYHPVHGVGTYKRDSSFRKPQPGMLLQAARDLDLHLPDCIMVGDKQSDMNAGKNAGVDNLFLLDHSNKRGEWHCIKRLQDVVKHLRSREIAVDY